MAAYIYTQLQASLSDLRLVVLKPGRYDDILRGEILHYPLLEPKTPFEDERLSVSELQKTLSDGWTVQQTLDGRYLFMSPRHSGIPNSWSHPDATFDPKAYSLPQHSVSDSFAWHVPPYEALSYCWGTAEDREFIHITDAARADNTPANLEIRSNLATALRHLRYPDRPRMLWIDAICINQADTEERGRQVKRMSQIYPLSQRVIIWLGTESDDSKHALETLDYFSKQVEYVISHRWGDTPDAQEQDWWRDGFTLPWDERTWNSISALLNRPWFERVWVLQEALSCNRVVLQCGRDTISWVHVRKALLVLRQKSSILPPEIRDRLFIYARGLMAPPLASSEHLFLWTRSQHCLDPRDKVYGILGLLDPRIVAKIEVNYAAPVWKTYAELVLAELEVYQKLNMINHCNVTTRLEGFPSWVPNFERPIEGANTAYLSIRRFYASARASAVAKYIEPENHLQVTGKRISTVNRVSDDLAGTFAQLFEVVLAWAPPNPESDVYVSGGRAIDAYVEVLVRGRTSDRALGDNPCPSIARLRELLTPALASAKLNDELAKAFKDCFFANECLFTTTDGYTGISARGLREGDELAVILGCDLPMVLRPQGSNQYELIGPCFVHGLMLGEALKPPLEPPWRDALPVTKGWALPYFINTETGEVLKDDVRLGPLPPGWEEVTSLDPFLPPFVFENKDEEHISVNDPRMSVEAIQQRGIVLDTLVLV